MARITCEDCLEVVGKQSRFKLIHLTVQRVKQHRQGEPFLVEGKNKEIVMTLREIAAGKVDFDNIHSLPESTEQEEKQEVKATEAAVEIS